MMLNISKSDVKTDPFPHVISEQFLDPGLYADLRADFPTEAIFENQKSQSSGGSRTGQGFDIYRGDPTYETLIGQSAAWREFDGFINSQAFVNQFLEVFGDVLPDVGLTATIDPAKYDGAMIEGREALTGAKTLSEKLGGVTRSFLGSKSEDIALFTRLDIHKALSGYAKRVHCDHANRLCSFILYFVDAEEIGLRGGQLTIHKHVKQKAAKDYERHPKPNEAPVVAKVTPKENMGVLFPCCNNSYHGVTAVESQGIPRDFLYINISASSSSLWG